MVLSQPERELLESARRAVLATIAPNGRPRLVPIAYAISDTPSGPVLYSALDEKPKSVTDPHALARVRDIVARPRVAVLVDRWSEDWSQLAWLRLDGRASILEPTDSSAAEHAAALRLLRERYPQYAGQNLEQRPIVRILVERVSGWPA
jgi:PPOX class probable F420-dependent enzyme